MSKLVKTCIVCAKEFSVWPAAAPRRKTCSRECGYEIQRVDHKRPKPCISCGKETTNPKYCSNKCQGSLLHVNVSARNRELFEEGALIYRRYIRPILAGRDGNHCSSCKLQEWLGKPITLWVDHVDGNAANNDPGNLRLICPNCDSQGETFMAKNKGSGRKSRGLKPWQ